MARNKCESIRETMKTSCAHAAGSIPFIFTSIRALPANLRKYIAFKPCVWTCYSHSIEWWICPRNAAKYFGMSWSWTIQINANQHTCAQIVLLQALVGFPNSAAWALKLLNFSPLRASMVKLQQFAGPWMFYVSSMPQCDATVSCLTLQRITLRL